jgi:hypothetical protein
MTRSKVGITKLKIPSDGWKMLNHKMPREIIHEAIANLPGKQEMRVFFSITI